MTAMTFLFFLITLELRGVENFVVTRQLRSNCPPFNIFCSCPKYNNGCYTCPSLCSSSGQVFQPGVIPSMNGGTSGASGQSVPVMASTPVTKTTFVPTAKTLAVSTSQSSSVTGSVGGSDGTLVCPPLASNCPQFMIKNDANNCPYCSESGGPNTQNSNSHPNMNNCPPKDPSIPWSKCHVDRQGCILCEGQIVTTQSTTTSTTSATTLTSSSISTKQSTTPLTPPTTLAPTTTKTSTRSSTAVTPPTLASIPRTSTPLTPPTTLAPTSRKTSTAVTPPTLASTAKTYTQLTATTTLAPTSRKTSTVTSTVVTPPSLASSASIIALSTVSLSGISSPITKP